jgi:hypothetical protein
MDMALDAFDLGYLMGLAVGEGSFTGDKQQPAFQLRMTEEDPEPIRRVNRLIGGSVYGPYNHSERRYYVLMLRGPALWRATTLFYDHLPNCKKRRLFLDWWRKYRAKLPPLPAELHDSGELRPEDGRPEEGRPESRAIKDRAAKDRAAKDRATKKRATVDRDPTAPESEVNP